MAKDKAGSLAIEVGVDDSKVTKTLAAVEREVRQSIKMFRDYDNALRNSDKTLKDFDKSINANQKSMKMVEQSIAGVKTKMAELENKTNNLATATEEERKHYDRLQRSLAKMESDYNQLSKASGNLKRQLAYEKTGVNQAEDAYRKLKEEQKLTFSEGTKGIKQARERLRGYREEQKQLRGVIKTLRDSVDELSKEFGKNSTEVLEAKKKLHNYQTELKTCTKNMNDFRATGGGAFTKVAEKATSLGRSMSMSVTAPIVTGLGAATAKATEFGDSMHKMQVLSEASKDEMKKLSDASKEAAKQYGVSTKEYNASATELLKTGYSVKESTSIMKAGLQASKASGEGLEVVLDKTSSTLKIFNMDAKEAGKVTDKLTYVANASKTSIAELGDGLSKVGPVAHNLGMSLDETSAALGVLQNNGFQVDVAATGLRSGLANLVNPSKANAEAFKKLGISLSEVKQKGIKLPKLLDNMSNATKGMSDATKEALIAQAFGKESMAQWTTLMGGTARKELKQFTEGAKKSNGTVNKMASDMSGTAKESINKFKGSLEVLGITFGEKILPKLTPLIDGITKLIQKFGNLNKGQQNFIIKAGLATAAAGPLIIALGGIGRGLDGIIKNIGSIGLVSTAIAGVGAVALNSFNSFEQFKNTAVGCWNQIVASYNASGIKTTIDELGKNIGKLFGVNSSEDKKGGKGKGNDDGAKQDWVTKAREISDAVMPILNAILKTINSVTLALQKLPDGVLPAIAGILPFVMVVRKLTKAFSTTKNAITGTINKVKSIPDSFRTAKEQVTSLGNKFKGLKDKAVSLKDKIKGVNKSVKGIDDGTKESLNAIKKGLDSVSDSAKNASNEVQSVGNSANEVSGINSKGSNEKKGKGKTGKTEKRKGKLKIPGKLGKVAGVALAGGGLFSNIIGGLSATDDAGQGAIDTIRGVSGILSFIPGPIGIGAKAISIGAGVFDTLTNSSDGAKNTISKFCNKAKEVFKGIPETIKKFFSPGADEYKNKVDEMSNSSEKSWKLTNKEFTEGTKKTAQKVEDWTAPKEFQNKYKKILELTKSFGSAISKGISSMLDKLTHSIRGSRIGEAFTGVFTKGWNGIAGVLQDICNGSGWVLKELGVDSGIGSYGNRFKSKPVKYAKGTDGHPGGLMMVNDAAGSNYQELVVRPNGEAFIPQGRNVVMYGEPGTQVINGEHTNRLMSMLNVPKYAKGTGLLNSSMNFTRKKEKKEIKDIFEYEDKPESLVDKVFKSYVGNLSGKGFAYQVASGVKKLAKKGLIKKVKKGFEDALVGGDINGTWGNLGSNNWFKVDGNWVREWQYRLLEPIIKKYGFIVTDGGRRTWDNYDHSKGKAMDIALPGNPWGTYWKVAQQIAKMPLVKYVNSNLKSTITGHWAPSNLEPRADHIHVSFVKELLSQSELKGNKGRAGGSLGNPSGSGVARWRPYVIKALRANGLPTTPTYINAWMRQIQTESGGNPRAIGGNDGLNEGNAMGLLQVKPGTFAANKHPGHDNILNGYDNMLAAMNYAKHRYGVSGMLQVIGMGHGYEKGGLVTQHQLAQIAEGNKPEMVIPLTDTSRSVQLIRQAQRLVGEKHFEKENDKTQENEMLKRMLAKMQETNELLKALLLKDSDVYLDGNKVSAHMDARMKSEQTRRAIANGTI